MEATPSGRHGFHGHARGPAPSGCPFVVGQSERIRTCNSAAIPRSRPAPEPHRPLRTPSGDPPAPDPWESGDAWRRPGRRRPAEKPTPIPRHRGVIVSSFRISRILSRASPAAADRGPDPQESGHKPPARGPTEPDRSSDRPRQQKSRDPTIHDPETVRGNAGSPPGTRPPCRAS
ncbi:MAG: hypothetical protein MZV64_02620 [Ignavibacteriales bacterium]|nr:hypothetical protein [Ignavibacteriales bacterium]